MGLSLNSLVTVSIQTLFEEYGSVLPSGLEIEVSTNADIDLNEMSEIEIKQWFYSYEGDDIVYFDLRDNGVVCMDGEVCEVLDASNGFVQLKNSNGELDVSFKLSVEEFRIATFSSDLSVQSLIADADKAASDQPEKEEVNRSEAER